MASKVDWKQKYYELRSKYMQAVDVAFRLGMQEGQKTAELQVLQMQLEEAQQAAMMAAQQGGGGMPGEELPPEEAMMGGGEELPPEEAMMGEEEIPLEEGEEIVGPEESGDELGESINELEGLVAKNEKDFDFTSVLKKFHQLNTDDAIQKDESKTKKEKKIAKILKKWDEDSPEEDSIDEDGSEETHVEDVIGQA